MNKLSVVIITLNEEKNIGRCIDSVLSIADEIIVLDSFSTDKTVSIASEKGATVYQLKFLGYIQQKNKALEYASNSSVLSLDADEALDVKLINSIGNLKKTGFNGAYNMNRCTNYCGKFIKHGLWYPDNKIRLFNKTEAHWGGTNPHDKIILEKNNKVYHLQGDILHYSFPTIEDHVKQNNNFSTISARVNFEKGKKTNLLKILINPFWAFIRGYFLRLGFLDGFAGYVIAKNIAHLTFLKHVKLFQLQKLKD